MRVCSPVLALACALAQPAQAATENRSVSGFDEVLFTLAGEVRIEQGARESLSVEAEPAVLRKITTQVRDGRLHIGLAPGRVETQQPIRLRIGVRTLRMVESRGNGDMRIGPLTSEALALVMAGTGTIQLDRLEGARSLDVRITGAGDVAVEGGTVRAQRLAIAGSGNYTAPRLASERAEVAIDGNGQARLAASTWLAVQISGIGQVRYRGDPVVKRTVAGIGTVEKED